MKVSTVMTTEVISVDARTSLGEAAKLMRQHDIGSLVVLDDHALVGMVTDRDLVVRGMAEGKHEHEAVAHVMTEGVNYCYEDEEVEDVARTMAHRGVRRLPVVNRAQQRLVGFVSLANIGSANSARATAELVQGTAEPH